MGHPRAVLAAPFALWHEGRMARAWLETRVVVPADAADAVSSYLIDLGSPGLVTEDAGGEICLVAYLEDEDAAARLRRYLERAGIDGGAVATQWITDEAWAENWKQHFPPLVVGRRLYVCPPWDEADPAGRIRIVIHPGMAFGTGHHATTRGCLELIERWLPPECERALDVGTGSGVLAIALVLLGVARVVAVDTDPLAREAAAENAERNGVSGAVEIHSSLREIEEAPFDLIAANLQLDVLLEVEPELAARNRDDGLLIASGLIERDAAAFERAYAPRWRQIDRIDDGEWLSLAMRRKATPTDLAGRSSGR